MGVSIDVVIPSFRLIEHYLVPILQLKRPAGARVRFYLLSDNPEVAVSPAIADMVNGTDVFLEVNPQNMGAAYTRNRGIESGDGDWVLFLDDDITVPADLLDIYARAAEQEPRATGFIGLVRLPAPGKPFSDAILASGSMDIFTIAEHRKDFAWGATANIMVRRSAIGNIRFSEVYPKSGGGEDVDFFLKVRAANQYENYRTLPAAEVNHPWWKNEAPDFKRPFRYGTGNALLPEQLPQHASRELPNTMETVLLAVVAAIVAAVVKPALLGPIGIFIGGVLAIECIATTVQSIKRKAKPGLLVYWYVVVLRLSHDLGLLWGNLRRGKIEGITRRFNDNGGFRKSNLFRTNTYKIVKWILYPLLIWLAWSVYTSA
ncbi:glycosyltransferase family 2 protein [Chitinophaga caseinilytica]|uniref:glycosyltransferase family 2 protein n=1 Tax=Chitinophaga caseinilytica TaxID=2267521 RepID=UPI003C2FB0FD